MLDWSLDRGECSQQDEQVQGGLVQTDPTIASIPLQQVVFGRAGLLVYVAGYTAITSVARSALTKVRKSTKPTDSGVES